MEQQEESKEADNPAELAWCLLNCHGGAVCVVEGRMRVMKEVMRWRIKKAKASGPMHVMHGHVIWNRSIHGSAGQTAQNRSPSLPTPIPFRVIHVVPLSFSFSLLPVLSSFPVRTQPLSFNRLLLDSRTLIVFDSFLSTFGSFTCPG